LILRHLTSAHTTEDREESITKLCAHYTIEDKIHRTVYQNKNIEYVSQGDVNILEDIVVDAAEEREYALRHLRDDERENDENQHGGRPVILGRLVRGGGAPARGRFETGPPATRCLHRANEERA